MSVSFAPSLMSGQVHVSSCHTNKILGQMTQGTSVLCFDVSRSEGHPGSRSFSLLHPDHYAVLSYMVHATGETISDPFQSRLVGNTQEPNHLYGTLVLSCWCLYCC